MTKSYEDLCHDNATLHRELVILRNQFIKAKKQEPYPADYLSLKQQVKDFKSRCFRQEKIINSGNLSSLQTLIDQYTMASKTFLKRFSIEFQLCEWTTYEQHEVEDIISFLTYMIKSLQELVPGSVIFEIYKEEAAIAKELQRINGLGQLSEATMQDLSEVLVSFHRALRKYSASPTI